MARSPECAREIEELVRAGTLAPERAAPLLAVARGELVSIRGELRALVGLGVLLVTAGVGLFLKEHHDDLGPGVIALALTLAAVGCLVAVTRRSPPFTWQRVPEPDWLVDGLLLLAIALLGADLAWIEVEFTPLGTAWSWHLLWMSALTAALAVRFDSTPAWTLALSTFAAWRGVAVTPTLGNFEHAMMRGEGSLRWHLVACAAAFAAVGWACARFDRKRHFEPASTFLASLAGGAAIVPGLGDAASWPLWALALAAFGLGVARLAFVRRRLGLFALGGLALYVGVTRFLFEIPGWYGLGCFWFALTSIGAIVVLVVVHRRFRAGGEA